MASVSMQEYLKRYESKGSDNNRQKKKKKHTLKGKAGLKIFDEDVQLNSRPDQSGETGDDAPTIAEFIDERPRHIREQETYNNNTWKGLNSFIEQSPNARNGSDSDDSLPRRRRHDSDEEINRGKGYESDQSLPRRRKESNSDESPPRRQRKGYDSDQSPPRRNTKDKGSDHSPPRRQRNNNDSDQSPPRKSRKGYNSDQSPPRKRKNSDSDISPPRRKRNEYNSDNLPARRRRRGSDSDQSPPRKNRKHSDQSPHRKGRESSSKRHSPTSAQRHTGTGRDSHSTESNKMHRTLGGAKAGLSSAKEMMIEAEKLRDKENEAFRKIDSKLLGKDAETVYRSRKTGKRRNLQQEAEDDEEELAKKAEERKKYDVWNKGVKQKQDQATNLESALHEMSKPLARYKDDQDLDKMQREMEREDDPMLQFMRKKKQKNIPAAKQRPVYKGPAPPPNRFGIKPGYRWDGVNRTTGFEKKLFASRANRKATDELAHKWSVEDM